MGFLSELSACLLESLPVLLILRTIPWAGRLGLSASHDSWFACDRHQTVGPHTQTLADMFYTADNLHELEAHLASNPEV